MMKNIAFSEVLTLKEQIQYQPGQVVSTGKQGIEMACADGETLMITELQAPGKKRMKAADFLRGHPIKIDS